jgi:hypothetical protein
MERSFSLPLLNTRNTGVTKQISRKKNKKFNKNSKLK